MTAKQRCTAWSSAACSHAVGFGLGGLLSVVEAASPLLGGLRGSCLVLKAAAGNSLESTEMPDAYAVSLMLGDVEELGGDDI